MLLLAEALLMQWKISIAEESGGHFQRFLFPSSTAHADLEDPPKHQTPENSKGEIEISKSVPHSPLISLAVLWKVKSTRSVVHEIGGDCLKGFCNGN